MSQQRHQSDCNIYIATASGSYYTGVICRARGADVLTEDGSENDYRDDVHILSTSIVQPWHCVMSQSRLGLKQLATKIHKVERHVPELATCIMLNEYSQKIFVLCQ